MNKQLKDNVYNIPQNVLDHIKKTLENVNQNEIGIDRATTLLNDRTVTYGQLKKIIHDLQNVDKLTNTYHLYGGDDMERWAHTFLNGERSLLKNKKKASANINNNLLGRKNPFLKTHEKKETNNVNLGIKSNSQSVAQGLQEQIKSIKRLM